MAELAIPLVALGGMYIMANQDNEDIKKKPIENYSNMGKPVNYLPNTKKPAVNYPVLENVKDTNVKKYYNPNQTTDKYFSEKSYMETANQKSNWGVGGNIKEINSMSGNVIKKENFKHNNMVPFFGGKIKGATVDANISESILDNMQGTGTQQFRKREQAPLYKPEKNMQWMNGTPNMSEFLLSRVNPSMKMANIKPWEEQKVAPGLNQGYTTEGSNGFNSGMVARDTWLPKTVDELRTQTNPKVTYGLSGHEGPANSFIKNVGRQGVVEKNRPDTDYKLGKDRWFTTTGLEKAQTARGIEMLQDVNRTTTTTEYFGSGGNDESSASYVIGKHEDAKRSILQPNPVSNCVAQGQYNPSKNDYGVEGYKPLPNNRVVNRQADDYGIVGGMMKAVVAPLLDVVRPSRKENVVGNLRPTGNATRSVPMGQVYNPLDKTKTTVRETTEGKLDFNHLNYENQKSDGYLVSKQSPIENQRDTTNTSYTGNVGTQYGDTSHEATSNQRNNVNKTYVNRPNQGGTQMFNQKTCLSNIRDDDARNNNRMWVPNNAPSIAPSTTTHGKLNVPQYTDQCNNCERISPDILTAFKNNPYTKSLNSWA